MRRIHFYVEINKMLITDVICGARGVIAEYICDAGDVTAVVFNNDKRQIYIQYKSSEVDQNLCEVFTVDQATPDLYKKVIEYINEYSDCQMKKVNAP